MMVCFFILRCGCDAGSAGWGKIFSGYFSRASRAFSSQIMLSWALWGSLSIVCLLSWWPLTWCIAIGMGIHCIVVNISFVKS